MKKHLFCTFINFVIVFFLCVVTTVINAQDYVFVITGPNQDNYYVGEKVTIRWTYGYGINKYGKIEYTVNHGDSWIVLENSISLENGYYNWVIPQSKPDECFVRITSHDGVLQATKQFKVIPNNYKIEFENIAQIEKTNSSYILNNINIIENNDEDLILFNFSTSKNIYLKCVNLKSEIFFEKTYNIDTSETYLGSNAFFMNDDYFVVNSIKSSKKLILIHLRHI